MIKGLLWCTFQPWATGLLIHRTRGKQLACRLQLKSLLFEAKSWLIGTSPPQVCNRHHRPGVPINTFGVRLEWARAAGGMRVAAGFPLP